jgi:hypothetical protein
VTAYWSNRKVYRRHGAGENQFGVSVANLRKLAKQIVSARVTIARSAKRRSNLVVAFLRSGRYQISHGTTGLPRLSLSVDGSQWVSSWR